MRGLKGSATIEMAYIMPVILLVISVSIYILFYFHDKNIVQGTAYEVAVILSQRERLDESADGESIFRERLGSKLIFFEAPAVQILVSGQEVTVLASVRRGNMGISVEQKAGIIIAEKVIRDKRRIENVIQE